LTLNEGDHGLVRYATKTGRRPEWTVERLNGLLIAVEAAKRKHGLSRDREALKVVAREKKWSPPPNHRRGLGPWIETLESRLQDAKRIKSSADSLLREFQNIGRRLRR